MREYMKNGNEYIEDGKRYVEKIKRCRCYRKAGDQYYLECRIHQRGERLQRCVREPEFIEEHFGGKPLWLSDDAKATVSAAIESFERSVGEAENCFKRASLEALGMVLYYEYDYGWMRYRYVIEFKDKEGAQQVHLFENGDLHSMLCDISLCSHDAAGITNAALGNRVIWSNEKTLKENPVYEAALSLGDVSLQDQLKLYFNAEDDADRIRLSEMLGCSILPRLSEDFDRFYTVDPATMDHSKLAGYHFLHVPYFAMRGKTHSKVAVNPHTRMCKDAAPADDDAMSFDEYLRMVRENSRR